MIKLVNENGDTQLINPSHIVSITASNKRAMTIIRMSNGDTISTPKPLSEFEPDERIDKPLKKA